MPNNLQSTIATLAASFAADLVRALRSMSLDEILAESRASASPATRAKRSTKDTKARGRSSGATVESIVSAVTVEALVAALKQHKNGLRAEHLRKALGVAKPAMASAVAKALASKKIKKKGQRRTTTYFTA